MSSEDQGTTEAEIELAQRRAEEAAPVNEAGEGVSEGFELAEEELIDNAENAEGGIPRDQDLGGAPETEDEPPEGTFGDADSAQSQDD